MTNHTTSDSITNFKLPEYEFLSNFYRCNIHYDGYDYPSLENAYQATKSVGDLVKVQLSDPKCSSGKAKKIGSKVELRDDWESIKIQVMEDLLRIKFTDPVLRDKLLSTGDKQLIEVNNWNDKFWGVCSKTCQGENKLGVLLMKIRSEIKNSVSHS